MKRFLALVLLAATALAPARLDAVGRAIPGQGGAARSDLPALPGNGRTLLGQHRDVRGQPQGGRHTDAAPMRLPLCRLLYQGADERERSAADGALELQPQAQPNWARSARTTAYRLPLPGRHQQRALRRAAQLAARRFLRTGVDLLSRRPRQRRPRERRRPVRRPDRPRPLGHLLRSRTSAASRSARAPSPTTPRPAASSRCPASPASSAAAAATRARPARPTTTSSRAARPSRGLPVVMVIGLPAQLAVGTYGGI